MINNCFFWAHWHFAKLWREWVRLGRPKDRVPCIQIRPSRSRPHGAAHHIVGWWHYESMSLQDARSFVPDNRHDVPWYLVWTRIAFKGHVKSGDNPSIPPHIEP